jgi:hypothetical protein
MRVICNNNDPHSYQVDYIYGGQQGYTLNLVLTLNKSYHVISSIQRIQMDQQLALGLRI